MNTEAIINKYYTPNSPLWVTLTEHSKAVRDKALNVVSNHPELEADTQFVAEAAMLHDIGIYLTNAPDLNCYGTFPYICHGYLGHDLLKREGYPRHALVCERHTGTGLSVDDIIKQKLPVPHRNMQPISIEEQIICFADKFYSKSRSLREAKSTIKIIKSMRKHGEHQVKQFEIWCEMFL
ncbi:HD domain-containing protein [Carboxylicivirga sediminis]|uniref:HD domain-containing protein n=1 Tax=Carboxylicivirga sediminis TaxID=2006564 RepID=A0A941F451_9BACT|nr:HD domain-containing protein [Carboxylicivirga sediminis]MBR8536493.1 HD domain-containing protein [Carboxylicivirga sediminis]